MDLDLLVIGATAAGWQGAIAAARLDHKVGLIALRAVHNSSSVDLRDVPGGLLRDVCHDWPIVKNGRRSQSPPVETTSWRQFADYTQRIWRQEQDAYREQLLAAGGTFWIGDPQLTGPHGVRLKRPRTKMLNFRADHLLVATGTAPRCPSFAHNFVPPAFDAAWLLSAPVLDAEACVVGAGLTGLRAACLLALWGSRVRVLDGRTVSAETSQEDVIDWHSWGKDLGVRFESGEDVIGLRTRSSRKMEIVLESGRQISTESVWLATGRQGRTAELCLGNAGLTTDDCGRLWCDPNHRTWVTSIHAAGDVVGFPPGMDGQPEVAGEIAANIFREGYVRAALA